MVKVPFSIFLRYLEKVIMGFKSIITARPKLPHD
jgi:hypothetical protein